MIESLWFACILLDGVAVVRREAAIFSVNFGMLNVECCESWKEDGLG